MSGLCLITRRSKGFINLLSNFYHQESALSMQAWQAHEFGKPDVLNLNTALNLPVLNKPTEILVKVHASSVNPIDVMMLNGYGASFVGALKKMSELSFKPEQFPLTLGRDFCGTVVEKGYAVSNVKIGDDVWGIVGIEQPGSHAEYVITSSYFVNKMPENLSYIEAASMPYAAMTAWSALSTFGGLSSTSSFSKQALVIGASGGVGTLAIQILKSWGAFVTAVCSTDAVEMVQNLKVDHVIDYQLQDLESELKHLEKFDFILDAVGMKNKNKLFSFLKKWNNSKYVTIVSPLLKNTDDYGIMVGSAKSSFEATIDTLMGIKSGCSARWAYCIPNPWALPSLTKLVNHKEVVPVIDKVFKFEKATEAYQKVLNGHARGKTVISNIEIPQEEIQEASIEETNEKIQSAKM